MCCSVTAGELTDEYRVGFRQKVRHPHILSFDQLVTGEIAEALACCGG